jgi:hypothetical protein
MPGVCCATGCASADSNTDLSQLKLRAFGGHVAFSFVRRLHTRARAVFACTAERRILLVRYAHLRYSIGVQVELRGVKFANWTG